MTTDNTGEWYASLLCKDVPAPEVSGRAPDVGIEVGVDKLAVTSDGEVYDGARNLERLEKRLALEQFRLSKMKGYKKGEPKSNHFVKQQKKVARLHKKIARARSYALHQASHDIVSNYETVYMRDTDVAGMLEKKGPERRKEPRFVEQMRHKNLADAAIGEFKRQVAYKEEWTGGRLVLVDKLYPSTQTCSSCGFVNRDVGGTEGISSRKWTCPKCGARHDRELNAAQNILKEGRKTDKGS